MLLSNPFNTSRTAPSRPAITSNKRQGPLQTFRGIAIDFVRLAVKQVRVTWRSSLEAHIKHSRRHLLFGA